MSFGENYILIHERNKDNVGRQMKPINRNYIKTDLPVVNLDIDWLRKKGLSVQPILAYVKVLQQAKEIHLDLNLLTILDTLSRSF